MRAFIVPLLVAVAFAAPALAADCVPSTSPTVLDTKTTSEHAELARHYVAMDSCWWCVTPYVFWVYEESNGIDGLQRWDEWVDDTCGGQITSDSVIW